MSTRRNNPAFTLIEMIVALTIIAAIMSMVYGSYAATTRSVDACNKRVACEERACFALRLMARQLRCAYAPCSTSASGGSPGSRTALDETARVADAPSAVFRADAHDPHGEILSLVTSGGTGAGPNAPRGLCRVTYRYDGATGTLAVSRNSRDGPLMAAGSNTILRHVASIELSFHDGRQWQPTWDFRQKHVLPRAVNVAITVADEMGRPHRLATTVPIIEHVHIASEKTRGVAAASQL
jgi:prepilin-type N-terminal cleavage/methylation domain-containing protein